MTKKTTSKNAREKAAQGKAKKSIKKTKQTKKIGVIASIIEFLGAASEEKPLSKDRLLAKLAKRFPDRNPESMLRTINVQVPTRLRTDKNIFVQRAEQGGYFIKTK